MLTAKTISVLGAARLSKESDESTSIALQAKGICGWADLQTNTTADTYKIAEITEDSDVSGSVSPFDRAGLGPYLRKPLLDTWQVLVVFRLDRLTRSIADFEALWKFLEANGKTLVSVAEQIDFGTMAGRLMARQLVIFAEYEREMVRARVKNAYDAHRASGHYTGMQFPFGYIPVKLDGKGWALDHHPVYADIVREIADRVIAGESLRSICRWLDAERIPTPRNAVREYKSKKPLQDSKWEASSLTAILTAPTVIGEATVNGKTLRDGTGMAVNLGEPLISRETWEKVRTIFADNAARRGPNVNTSPLLKVAYCAECGEGLYQVVANPHAKSRTQKRYRYYQCISSIKRRGCSARRIPADELEALTETSLLMRVGSVNITETVEIPGIDYSTQMMELAEAIGDLSTRIALARVSGQDVPALEEQRRIHETNLAELANEPVRLPEAKEIELDETWSQRWHCLDWPGRNELLRRKGIKLYAERDASGKVWGSLMGGSLESKRVFAEPEESR